MWKKWSPNYCIIRLLKGLLALGYTINSVIIDGKRGLSTVFKGYPVQMCHFHQKKIVERYITKNPKLEASIELQKILYRLTKTTETRFKNKLLDWYTKYENFLNEMTINNETGEVTYTHYKLRAAYVSLCANLDYLFTYKKTKVSSSQTLLIILMVVNLETSKIGLEFTDVYLKTLN